MNNDLRLGDIIVSTDISGTSDADVVIIGVPSDEGILRNGGRVGASQAPGEIRKYLRKLTPSFTASTDISKLSICDLGDLGDLSGTTLEELHSNARSAISQIIDKDKMAIVLGGGHDITYPLASGFHEGIKKTEFALVNIDAHLDVREKKDGLHHSGSSFRLLIEDGTLLGKNFIEFGIQPFSFAKDHLDWVEKQGANVVHFDTAGKVGPIENFSAIISKLSIPFYLSFDIDSIRSADAPGCSAPSPIGFSAEEAFEMCYRAGLKKETRVLDIVEVNPLFDRDGRTSRLAARMIAGFLAGVSKRN
jgi:formimidoylglutamase